MFYRSNKIPQKLNATLVSLLMLIFAVSSYAGTGAIVGSVKDSVAPLFLVGVSIEGTTRQAFTDQKGNFEISKWRKGSML